MTRSPIPKVLSTIRQHEVQSLLMGGQACILYGAAEFSRDADLAILLTTDNLERLQAALAELQATTIAVPPFQTSYLERGHAVHFRCHHDEAAGFRVDVMARMRGVASFPELWQRRTTVSLPGALDIDVLSLPDLVDSKKTQRDKDWPMIRRLVEVSYEQGRAQVDEAKLTFWLRELRTPELLIECVERFGAESARPRPAVEAAVTGDLTTVAHALAMEEAHERSLDRQYWEPRTRAPATTPKSVARAAESRFH